MVQRWSRAQAAGESCAHTGGPELFKAVILEASTPFSSSRQKKSKPLVYTLLGANMFHLPSPPQIPCLPAVYQALG